eukprot:596143-Rhodomonas_salina.1
MAGIVWVHGGMRQHARGTTGGRRVGGGEEEEERGWGQRCQSGRASERVAIGEERREGRGACASRATSVRDWRGGLVVAAGRMEVGADRGCGASRRGRRYQSMGGGLRENGGCKLPGDLRASLADARRQAPGTRGSSAAGRKAASTPAETLAWRCHGAVRGGGVGDSACWACETFSAGQAKSQPACAAEGAGRCRREFPAEQQNEQAKKVAVARARTGLS